MQARLVIFDLDGTLVDSFALFVQTHNALAARHRLAPIGPDELDALRQLSPAQMMRHVGLPAWRLPLVARDFRRLMGAQAAAVRPFEGVAEALGHLRGAGVRLAIATSNSLAHARASLGALVDHFERLECGLSLFGKHARLRAILRASGIAPADAIFVGDQLTDLEAARRVPLRFAAVRWGYASPAALLAHRPDLMLERPAQLAALAPVAPPGDPGPFTPPRSSP